MNIEKYLETKKEQTDRQLKKLLPQDDSLLSRAMKYSALAPGKRIRAMLTMAACSCSGGDERHVLDFGCAIEMLHAFSLIHDDLPAMDDDDLRRGLPTNHIKFGEGTAILAGDALFALAYKVMARSALSLKGKVKDPLEVIDFISGSIGHLGMCSGQSLDLESEGKKITFEKLRDIHSKKTGALIIASVFAGAKLAGASDAKISGLQKYAKHLGLAFQIKDDILDISGNAERLGKTPGSDLRKNKSTYVSFFGIEKAKEMLNTEKHMAIDSLSLFGPRADILKKLAVFVADRDK